MPTYEYRCKACGHELDVVQSFTDDALTTCNECGGALRKVFGNVGIAFKGTGFYKNDSRGKTASATSNSDTSSAGTGAGTGNGDKSGRDKSGSDKSGGEKGNGDGGSTPKKDSVAASTPSKSDGTKSPTPGASTKSSTKGDSSST